MPGTVDGTGHRGEREGYYGGPCDVTSLSLRLSLRLPRPQIDVEDRRCLPFKLPNA